MTEDDRLEKIIDFLREFGASTGDEEKIDLEIDLLPIATQRKLLNFVNKVSIPKGKFSFIRIQILT